MPGPASDTVDYEPLGSGRALLVGVFALVALGYFVWRATVFNPDAIAFSAVLYAAELGGLGLLAIQVFFCWRLARRRPGRAPDGETVDILVVATTQPADIVRRAVLAARRVQYPHATWLVDAGVRPEVEAIARELGVRYAAGAGLDAGRANALNQALAATRSRFIAVFDAGHAPAAEFLDETLGLAGDGVGFVQTAHEFYNLDSFEHRWTRGGRLVWNAQSLILRVLQRGRDYWGACHFDGSCAVFRRDALEAIGGFAEGSAADDLATSVRIHKKGWRSVYNARPLAFGAAPQDATAFLRRRLAWAGGALQVLRNEGLISSPGLTLPQRLSYLDAVLTSFDGWRKGIFYLTPVVALFAGVLPVAAVTPELLLGAAVYYGLASWVFVEIGRGWSHVIERERYGMARFAVSIASTGSLLGAAPRPELPPPPPPPGAPPTAPTEVTRRLVTPQALVFQANAVAVAVGIGLELYSPRLPLAGLIAAVSWALVNAALAASVVAQSIRVAGFRRRDYRFPIPLPVEIAFDGDQPVMGVLDNVSSSGFRFQGQFEREPELGARGEGIVFLPSGPLPFQAMVRARVPDGAGVGLGCSFEWHDAAERDRLDMFLYGSDLQWQVNGFRDHAQTPIDWLGRALLGRNGHAELGGERWAPAVYTAAGARSDAPEVGFISVPPVEAGVRTFVALRPLAGIEELSLRVLSRSGAEAMTGTLRGEHRIDTHASSVYCYQFTT